MAKSSSLININGNQYNALTGQLVGSAKQVIQKAKKTTSFQSIDGFVRKSASKTNLSASADKKASSQPSSPKPSAQKVHKRTQKTQTLMRGGLKRPGKSEAITNRIRKSPSADILSVQPARAKKASSILKHPKVSRFGQPKPPVAKAEVIQKPKINNSTNSQTQKSVVSKAVTMPSMVTSTSHQHLERLLDLALLKADAHKQALRGNSASQNYWHKPWFVPRWIAAGGILLVLIIAGAFFAWQNIPQLSMKLAASKAHISASVPAYSPSGFSFSGPIGTSGNEVVMKFTANGNPSRNFSISQKGTSLDSASLLANYISPNHHNYQTSQVKGTTVYMYGANNDATWINNGIWYTIKDNASLNSEQLLKIADSM